MYYALGKAFRPLNQSPQFFPVALKRELPYKSNP